MFKDDKTRLWRNTLGLFYQTRVPAFEGPFHVAHYELKMIDRYLGTETEDKPKKGHRPDIVAIRPAFWACIELTANNGDKNEQILACSSIDPRLLEAYGIENLSAKPDVICSRLANHNEDGYCEICVNKIFEVKGLEHIHDDDLRLALDQARGSSLERLPTIPITMFPEMQFAEIKCALHGHVLQLFTPDLIGKTAEDIVEDGLERISKLVSPASKRHLVEVTKRALDELVKSHLKEYLVSEKGIYRARENIDHFASRQRVSQVLKKWADMEPTISIEEHIEAHPEIIGQPSDNDK